MQGRSGWAREDEFRDLLHKAASKATPRILDDVAALAIRDDKVAYKAVSALILHEMKQLRPQYRLKLLYALSAILRQSKERRGDKDKYGGCWGAAGAAGRRELVLTAAGSRVAVHRRQQLRSPRAVGPMPLPPPPPPTPLPPRSPALCAAAGQPGRPAGAHGGRPARQGAQGEVLRLARLHACMHEMKGRRDRSRRLPACSQPRAAAHI